MKNYLLILIFSLGSLTALAQPASIKTWQIKWAPLSLIDPRTPALQMGIQKQVNPHLALSAEYGRATLGWLRPDRINNYWSGFRYHKMRTELKYFFGLKDLLPMNQLHPYFSFETFILPQTYKKQNDYFWRDTVSYHYDYSKIQKTVWGNCLKMGLESNISRNWTVDMYWGLGVRSIFIKHADLVNLRPEEEPYVFREWFAGDDKDKKAGWQQALHIASGFKLGYYIR